MKQRLKPALDLNTKLLKAEASIALLTDDVEQAYELLSQAADSYLSIGISASILMRVSLEPVLSNYGTHKGRHGLNYALRFMKDALSKSIRAAIWMSTKRYKMISVIFIC